MDVPAGKRLDLRGKQLTEDLWIRGSDVYVLGGDITGTVRFTEWIHGVTLESVSAGKAPIAFNLPNNGDDFTLLNCHGHDVTDSAIIANGPSASITPTGDGLKIIGGSYERVGTNPPWGRGKSHVIYSRWSNTLIEDVEAFDWDGAFASLRQHNNVALRNKVNGNGRGMTGFTYSAYDVVGGMTWIKQNSVVGVADAVTLGAWETGKYLESFEITDNYFEEVRIKSLFPAAQVLQANNRSLGAVA